MLAELSMTLSEHHRPMTEVYRPFFFSLARPAKRISLSREPALFFPGAQAIPGKV